jgi:hypothetical protein
MLACAVSDDSLTVSPPLSAGTIERRRSTPCIGSAKVSQKISGVYGITRNARAAFPESAPRESQNQNIQASAAASSL